MKTAEVIISPVGGFKESNDRRARLGYPQANLRAVVTHQGGLYPFGGVDLFPAISAALNRHCGVEKNHKVERQVDLARPAKAEV